MELFIKELNIWGIKGLLNRRIQVEPTTIPGESGGIQLRDYQPDSANVAAALARRGRGLQLPRRRTRRTTGSCSSTCRSSLRTSSRQTSASRRRWSGSTTSSTRRARTRRRPNPDTPQQKYWVTKPFYETTKADYYKQKIENIMLAIAKGDAELRAQVARVAEQPVQAAPDRAHAHGRVSEERPHQVHPDADRLGRPAFPAGHDRVHERGDAALHPRRLDPRAAAEEHPAGRGEPDQDLLPAAAGGDRRLRQRPQGGREPAAAAALDERRRPGEPRSCPVSTSCTSAFPTTRSCWRCGTRSRTGSSRSGTA